MIYCNLPDLMYGLIVAYPFCIEEVP
jgi:hypothetical protein